MEAAIALLVVVAVCVLGAVAGTDSRRLGRQDRRGWWPGAPGGDQPTSGAPARVQRRAARAAGPPQRPSEPGLSAAANWLREWIPSLR
jgi:hypothetical protein